LHFDFLYIWNSELSLHLVQIWFVFVYCCFLMVMWWYFQIITFCDNFLVSFNLCLYLNGFCSNDQWLSITSLRLLTSPFFYMLILKISFDNSIFYPIYHLLYNEFNLFVHVANFRGFISLMSSYYFFHCIAFLSHLR
jgi:hypothetical protein